MVAGVWLAGVAVGGVALAPSSAAAQYTIPSSYVANHSVSGPPCDRSNSPGPAASASCTDWHVAGGTGTATAFSNYLVRIAGATVDLTQTGGQGSLDADAKGDSPQSSEVTVTGTPRPGDQLVFHFLHFLGVESLGGSGGDADAYAFWQLSLSGGGDQAYAQRKGFADGTQGPLELSNARQTSDGFDLFVSFPSRSLFKYSFEVMAGARVVGQPEGTAVGGAIAMRLDGVDAETAQGGYISSAVFDPATGLGRIDVPVQSTVPEPDAVALLGTGLAALLPLVRRRRRPLARQ
jgi:hypothetical protein